MNDLAKLVLGGKTYEGDRIEVKGQRIIVDGVVQDHNLVFEAGKFYRTRGGRDDDYKKHDNPQRKVEVIRFTKDPDYPMVCVAYNPDGTEWLQARTMVGKWYASEKSSSWDLIEEWTD